MPNIDVLKAKVLQLHSCKLQDELGLSAFVLKADFLDFARDKRFHFHRMKAKTPGKFVTSLKRDNSGFENISSRKSRINLRIRYFISFIRK
jgi:hypothetical protein